MDQGASDGGFELAGPLQPLGKNWTGTRMKQFAITSFQFWQLVHSVMAMVMGNGNDDTNNNNNYYNYNYHNNARDARPYPARLKGGHETNVRCAAAES
jgi:hypothetical protein